ncbi:hypothetical protein U9M48_025110 [Paspalum notatum var. saurae]|uniref:Uncharacterized protein n=1 Tax=Paspalum notatum var. saurae TaxID=547442 RepID=A0AAQ3TPG4_PASNO
MRQAAERGGGGGGRGAACCRCLCQSVFVAPAAQQAALRSLVVERETIHLTDGVDGIMAPVHQKRKCDWLMGKF